jgi:hypothetical protein
MWTWASRALKAGKPILDFSPNKLATTSGKYFLIYRRLLFGTL